MSKVEIDNKKKEIGSRKTTINKSTKETKVVNPNSKSTNEQVKFPAIQPTRKTIGPPVNIKSPTLTEKDKSIIISSPGDKPKVTKSNTIVNLRNKQTKSIDSKVENKDLPKVIEKINNDKTESIKQDEKITLDSVKPDQTDFIPVTSTESTNNIDSNVSISKDIIPPVDDVSPVPLVIVNNNGLVKLIYETYDELFPITDGSTTHENIDEVYALSFVMPNCRIHLSKYDPKQKRQLEIELKPLNEIYIEENPTGVYHGLIADEVYYVYIEQDSIQLELEKENNAKVIEILKNDEEIIKKDDGRVIESCSCIYGNPCVDEYGCKDWNNRYAIAKANGWKGF